MRHVFKNTKLLFLLAEIFFDVSFSEFGVHFFDFLIDSSGNRNLELLIILRSKQFPHSLELFFECVFLVFTQSAKSVVVINDSCLKAMNISRNFHAFLKGKFYIFANKLIIFIVILLILRLAFKQDFIP